MLRRILTTILSLLMVSGLATSPQTSIQVEGEYLTFSDTVVIISELHSAINGRTLSFKNTEAGHQAAESYAKENGIMTSLPDESYMSHYIARSEFVYLIANASRDVHFETINSILDGQIVDVNIHRYYADAVYSFARAGIIACDEGLFNPDEQITISEAKEIAARIQNKSERIKLDYTKEPDSSACVIADDSFYISPVGHTRFTNIYVSTSYDDGYINVECSNNGIISANIDGWYDEHNAELYIAAKKEGVAIITLTSKSLDGTVLAEDKLKVTVEGYYKEASEARIDMDCKSLQLKTMQKRTVKTSFSIPNNECNNPMIQFVVDNPEIIQATWGDWEDENTTSLDIQGLTEGDTIIYIELFDEDTGCYLTDSYITVHVSDEVNVELDVNPKMC